MQYQYDYPRYPHWYGSGFGGAHGFLHGDGCGDDSDRSTGSGFNFGGGAGYFYCDVPVCYMKGPDMLDMCVTVQQQEN